MLMGMASRGANSKRLRTKAGKKMTPARTQVTLKDVARVAECSTAVVSTVINRARGNTLVSEELRKRVEEAARKLGYRPNFASRSLVSRRTRTLGVYIPPAPWSGPGFAYEGEILKGIEHACRTRGYDLLLINLTGDQEPQACIEKFGERRIDGLLLVHAEPGSLWIRDLLNAGCNVVAVDYANPDADLNAMVFDNAGVSRVAIDHLVQLGHRKIGFLGSCKDPISKDGMARQVAFLEYAREVGVEVKPEWVYDVTRAPRPLRDDEHVCQLEGLWGAQHILSLGKDGPTAWMVYSDLVAANAMPHLQANGVCIPEDVSLIGVDDAYWCHMTNPPLSSIGHPLYEMGQRAVELLIEISERTPDTDQPSRTTRGVHELFAPRLVARGTTAPPPNR